MAGIRKNIRHSDGTNVILIDSAWMHDDRLSAESLGVICYLRANPSDWTPSQLQSRFNCGRDRIHRILKELVAYGYLVKGRPRDPVTKSWLPVQYTVSGCSA